MVVGIIDHETGTRDIRRLGGLIHLMPISFTLTVIGGFSMAGLPPFNGFLSKEMFFAAVNNAAKMDFFHMGTIGVLIPIIAWIASVFTFIYCMILVFKTFRGKYKLDNDRVVHEAPLGMLISPIILGSLVIVGFFFPNLLSKYLLKPALTSVLPVLSEAEVVEHKIKAWHGFLSPELWMTIGVVVLGAILYLNLRKWYKVYNSYPQSLTFNNLYNLVLEKMEQISGSITNFYMTGYIRDYLVYIIGFLILVVGGSIWLLDGVSFDSSNDAPATFFEIAVMIVAVVSAGTVLFSKSRITSIVAVGALGFLYRYSLYYSVHLIWR